MNESIKADYQHGTKRMRRFALRHGKYCAFLNRKWRVCCRVLAYLGVCDEFWKLIEERDVDINRLANAECFNDLFCCVSSCRQSWANFPNKQKWSRIWVKIINSFRTSEMSGGKRRWNDFWIHSIFFFLQRLSNSSLNCALSIYYRSNIVSDFDSSKTNIQS